MYFHFSFYLLPLFIAAAIAIALAILIGCRPLPYRVAFSLLMLAIADWAIGYALELGSATISSKLFWVKVQYFGIVVVPFAWLILVVQYAGREKWLTRKILALLCFDPTITALLAWTNEAHHLIWKDIKLLTQKPFSILDFEYGIWAKLHTAYAYFLVLFAIALLFHIFIDSYRVYRKQAGVLLIFSIVPFIGNAIYIFNLSPIDLTPFAFLLSGTLIAWSFIHFRLLDIKPIAIDTLIENMQDGVIALDNHCRIIEINPAAKKIIGCTDKIIGEPISKLASFHSELQNLCQEFKEVKKEIKVDRKDKKYYYEIHASPLRDKYGAVIGYLLLIHDVTERKEVMEKLEKALQQEKEFKLKTAHYFFNPLCIAKGYLEMVKKDCRKEEIDKIIEAIERIEKVIKNVVQKGEISE